MKTLPMGLVIAFICMAVLAVSGCVTAEMKRARLKEERRLESIKCDPERWREKNLKIPQLGGLTLSSSSLSTEAFAKTSGTSGCGKRSKKSSFYLQQQEFVAFTIDNLSEQIAQGGGPHLQALSSLLGCPASDYSKLATISRQSYEQLFPSAETEPEVFLARLKEEMRDNPSLADRCVNI